VHPGHHIDYKQLRIEWQEMVRNIQVRIRELEFDAHKHIDDLEASLMLMTRLPGLYPRLDEKMKTKLLQILVKSIIINPEGEIINYELNSPFMYLYTLASSLSGFCEEGYGSDHVLYRPPQLIHSLR